MSIIWNILLLGAIVLIGYSIWANYRNTSPTDPTPKRVWTAVITGMAAFFGWVWAAIENGGVPTQ